MSGIYPMHIGDIDRRSSFTSTAHVLCVMVRGMFTGPISVPILFANQLKWQSSASPSLHILGQQCLKLVDAIFANNESDVSDWISLLGCRDRAEPLPSLDFARIGPSIPEPQSWRGITIPNPPNSRSRFFDRRRKGSGPDRSAKRHGQHRAELGLNDHRA